MLNSSIYDMEIFDNWEARSIGQLVKLEML